MLHDQLEPGYVWDSLAELHLWASPMLQTSHSSSHPGTPYGGSQIDLSPALCREAMAAVGKPWQLHDVGDSRPTPDGYTVHAPQAAWPGYRGGSLHSHMV